MCWSLGLASGVGVTCLALSVAAQGAEAGKSGVSPQTISLPSGPGSIEGLGESFEPQLNSGTYVYRVPLKLPPMRQGAAPSLALEYNSGSGNGMIGMGWQLMIPEIKRQTDKGLPAYDTNDTFIDWTGEELARTADGYFRCENEGLFARFQFTNNHWLVTMRNGTRLFFGRNGPSRLDRNPGQSYCWKLELSEDLNGNRIAYRYTNYLQQLYPIEIEYGLHATEPSATFRVRFDYTAGRTDPVVDYRPRFRSETRLRLSGVTAWFGERRIRHWRLSYHTNAPVSLLASVTMFGDERSRLDGAAVANEDFLPPTFFDYTPALQPQERRFFTNRMDVVPHFTTGGAEFADLNRDGLPDLIYEFNGEWFSSVNRGGGRPFAGSQAVTNVTAGIRLNQAGTRLVDLTGDGATKLLAQLSDTTNYFFREFVSPTELGPPVNFRFALGDFQLDNPDLQFVDANHDKAVDVMRTFENGPALLLNRALGPQAGREAVYFEPPPDASMNGIQFSGGWQLADMNGDRLLDLVLFGPADEGNTQVRLTRGLGEFEVPFAMSGGPIVAHLGSRGESAFSFVDVNQDGLSDLAQVESGAVRVWLSHDGRMWEPPIFIESSIPLFFAGETTIRFLDLNGNGSTDVVWHQVGTDELIALDLHPFSKPYQLNRALTGMGRGLEITYKSSVEDMLTAEDSTNRWTSTVPFPVQVVGTFVETDGLGGRYRTEITYRNGYYDGMEREFRGFETAVRRDLGNDTQGAPTLMTEYRFDTGAAVEALKGKPLRVERRTVSGEIFDRVSTVWTNRQLPLALAAGESHRVNFAFQSSEQTDVVERGTGPPVTLRREFQWDDYGNQTRLADYGRVEGANYSAWNDERVTVRSFTAAFPDGLAQWILGLPVTEEIQDENGAVVARTHLFYDDETFAGNNAGQLTLGRLTLSKQWTDPAGTAAFIQSSRTKYDVFGNPTRMHDPLWSPASPAAGHFREVHYETNLHTFPVLEVVHTGNPAAPFLTVQARYDLGLAVMTSSADFNTNTLLYHYDTVGRISSITKPGDTTNAPTELYSYELGIPLSTNRTINYIAASKRETAGGGTLESRLFFDGLGRKVMVRAEGETPGQTVVTDTVVYNDRRAVWKKYLPYFDTGGLNWNNPTFTSGFVESHYDALGRATRAYQPEVDGERVFAETVYEPLARLVKDEEQARTNSVHFGSAMRHTEDGLRNKDGAGRLRQVQEIAKLTGSGAPAGPPQTWTTSYEYDLLDQLTRITDSQNNVKVMNYDGLARLKFMDDPDRGEMHYAYDDASNLRQTTDNKGQVIQYTYDGANRIKTEDYLDAAGRTPDVEYFYDASLPGFAGGDVRGQLAAVHDLSGEEHLSYDPRSRIVSQIKRIPDPVIGQLVSFTTSYTYDSLDRMVALTYPDGDVVTNLYNPRGLLTRITGGPSGSIISNITHRASAQLDTIAYGNAVVTTYDYDPRLRLKDLNTDSPVAGKLIDFHYQFDAVSNIRRIDDNRDLTGQPDAVARKNTQAFGYDSLYRLTAAEYPAILADTPGRIDYRYDRIGNMVSQLSNIPHVEDGKSVTDLGTMASGGSAGSTGRMGKGAQPGPHALTSISQPSTTNSQSRIYPYDANGNMTHIDGLTNTWDFKDRLITVENNKMRAEYAYDYTDRRITKNVAYKPGFTNHESRITTLYINKFFEMREHDSPVKYVWNGETRVARVSGTLSTSAQRQQFLRLHPGWNLASINVGNAQGKLDPANQPFLSAAVYWTNNSPGGEFLPITATTALPAGSVAWLQAIHPSVLTLNGSPPVEQPAELDPAGEFLANTTSEGWDMAAVFPSDASLWRFDAQVQGWQERLTGQIADHTLPANISAGESVFIKPTTTNRVNRPSASHSIRYYHQDHLGSSSVMSDRKGLTVQETANYPFGRLRVVHRSNGLAEAYSFVQKERDAETKFYYLEARYLITACIAFGSVDPLVNDFQFNRLSQPQKLNPYSYSYSRPIVLFDPTGRQADWAAVFEDASTLFGMMDEDYRQHFAQTSQALEDWGTRLAGEDRSVAAYGVAFLQTAHQAFTPDNFTGVITTLATAGANQWMSKGGQAAISYVSDMLGEVNTQLEAMGAGRQKEFSFVKLAITHHFTAGGMWLGSESGKLQNKIDFASSRLSSGMVSSSTLAKYAENIADWKQMKGAMDALEYSSGYLWNNVLGPSHQSILEQP